MALNGESVNKWANGKGVIAIVTVLGVLIGTLTFVFTSIEKRFEAMEGLRSRDEKEINLLRAWKEKHDRIIEKRDAEQWERIKALEREVFKEGR